MNTQDAIAALDPKHGVFIDGRGLGTDSTFDVYDPATQEVIAEVSDGSAAEATDAVTAAHSAFRDWAATPARVRAEMLRRAFDLMIADTDRLAALICIENGKPQADARAEVAYAAEFFRWFSEEAVRTDGAYGVSPGGGTRTIVTHRPVGVAALVTPWNFPAAMATRKIAPALAAGCTVVLKPAAETPLTALAIAKLLAAAGVPDGVVNVVPTTDANCVVSTWLSDDRVRKISFTGSTGVGRMLLKQAADRVLNASMELGGNAPFVVTADADIAAAVEGAMIAKFRGGGQACTAANRFYVHASVGRRVRRTLRRRDRDAEGWPGVRSHVAGRSASECPCGGGRACAHRPGDRRGCGDRAPGQRPDRRLVCRAHTAHRRASRRRHRAAGDFWPGRSNCGLGQRR